MNASGTGITTLRDCVKQLTDVGTAWKEIVGSNPRRPFPPAPRIGVCAGGSCTVQEVMNALEPYTSMSMLRVIRRSSVHERISISERSWTPLEIHVFKDTATATSNGGVRINSDLLQQFGMIWLVATPCVICFSGDADAVAVLNITSPVDRVMNQFMLEYWFPILRNGLRSELAQLSERLEDLGKPVGTEDIDRILGNISEPIAKALRKRFQDHKASPDDDYPIWDYATLVDRPRCFKHIQDVIRHTGAYKLLGQVRGVVQEALCKGFPELKPLRLRNLIDFLERLVRSHLINRLRAVEPGAEWFVRMIGTVSRIFECLMFARGNRRGDCRLRKESEHDREKAINIIDAVKPSGWEDNGMLLAFCEFLDSEVIDSIYMADFDDTKYDLCDEDEYTARKRRTIAASIRDIKFRIRSLEDAAHELSSWHPDA